MAKPSISLVKEWIVAQESDVIQVSYGSAVFDADYWKVTPITGKPKYFYGESAWSDAHRYADDAQWQLVKDGLN